jgi:hypothetical protein
MDATGLRQLTVNSKADSICTYAETLTAWHRSFQQVFMYPHWTISMISDGRGGYGHVCLKP